eukprot:TRINITY_DN78401_c0_g1_i1.p1 TRINITY_DN78401_c0_g1~~TRINITY_DN78401_c0_g1_i1.p1  ORF type:complete len:503 (-),score=128.97 TRINITY_DN78401_c0_g1_i1:47-1507(-)
MAKRKPWCGVNKLQLCCFLALFSYGAWLLASLPALAPGNASGAVSTVQTSESSEFREPVPEAAGSEDSEKAQSEDSAGALFSEEVQGARAEVEELSSEQAVPQQVAAGAGDGPRKPALLVAMAARLKQLEGPLVVMSSALKHARDKSRLQFRVLTTKSDVEPLVAALKARLTKQLSSREVRDLDIAAVSFDPWSPRVAQLLGGKSSSRKELFDALNFAAFYLHEVFPDPPGGRVLYLDTDVVVKSDLAAELASRKLNNQPAAAAEDCSQKIGKYVDMDRLKKKGVHNELPFPLHATKKACVVNRGVVLVDTKRWAAANITGAIETLVAAHLAKGRGPLWRSGVSQPPFLLAIAGRYHDLGAEYNVRGLGRGDIAPEEVDYYKKQKAWSSYYSKYLLKCEFNCCPGCKGWSLSPFVSPLAHQAKILHFNGRLKPSAAGHRSLAPVLPPPPNMEGAEQAAREQRPLCSCGKECLQECAGLWWEHLPPE